jgi:hypothetical protein
MGKHKFDPKHIPSLEDPKRLLYEDPDNILSPFFITATTAHSGTAQCPSGWQIILEMVS